VEFVNSGTPGKFTLSIQNQGMETINNSQPLIGLDGRVPVSLICYSQLGFLRNTICGDTQRCGIRVLFMGVRRAANGVVLITSQYARDF